MTISFAGIEPDGQDCYVISYNSKILGTKVPLTIPTDDGTIEKWQLELVSRFNDREEWLRQDVYHAILDHYLEVADELREQFGREHLHLVPSIDSIDQLKELIIPAGVYIGELEPEKEAVGLLFECTWDGEHGLGVLLNNWKVKEVGLQEVAFTI